MNFSRGSLCVRFQPAPALRRGNFRPTEALLSKKRDLRATRRRDFPAARQARRSAADDRNVHVESKQTRPAARKPSSCPSGAAYHDPHVRSEARAPPNCHPERSRRTSNILLLRPPRSADDATDFLALGASDARASLEILRPAQDDIRFFFDRCRSIPGLPVCPP